MSLKYSKPPTDQPYNLHPDADEAESRERLSAFFAGAPVPTNYTLDLGATTEQIAARNAATLSELDDLVTCTATPEQITPSAPEIEDEPTWEIIEDEPVPTPYDRARMAVRAVEAERAACVPETEEYAEATGRLIVARLKLKLELDRDGDDEWRKRRRIDEHRAGEGREEYNTCRRKVRPEPNVRLTDMAAAERAAHENTLNADRVWKSKKRKAGWTEEKIKAGLEKRQMKRLTKDAWTV